MPTLYFEKLKKPIICDLLLSPENKMLLKESTDIINNDKHKICLCPGII